jgi:hypothetical protein
VSNDIEMATHVRMGPALALLCLTGQHAPLGADQTSDRPAVRSLAPAPVRFAVRVADGRRRFRPGEIIPIELEFDSDISNRFVVDGATYDHSGRLTIDEFRVEPNDRVIDPMLDYFASAGGTIGGGIRGMGTLGEKPFIVKLDLNDWFRFEEPGTYTLSARSQRVTDEAGTTPSIVPVESNTVSFEILPRDADWEAAEIGAALQLVDSTSPGADRKQGCRMLRFLATDAAVDEMIRRFDDGLPDCSFDFPAGLVGAPNHERVVRQLEAGLREPDRPIGQSYLRTLAILSVYEQHPEFRPPQTRAAKGRMEPPGELSRHPDLMQAAEAAYVDILTEALPDKTDRARALTLAALLSAQRSRSASAGAGANLRADLTATFLELPPERQTSLLEYEWSSVASAGMRPVLRRLAEKPTTGSPSLSDLALRRLYQLAPEEGRALIIRQIRDPSPGASLRTLGMLPDGELSELDDVLAANVDVGLGYEKLSIRAELLQRYASPAVSSRLAARVNDALDPMACRPKAALLAYFVRADPQLGRSLLERALESRATTGCYTSVLRDVGKLRMTPVVEETAIGNLDDPDPHVVTSAVETLGRYGSREAREPLRAHFERWHQVWDGRQEELRYRRIQDRASAVQGVVEVGLLQALGQGQGWFSDERDLRELRSLCVTDNCRAQADQMIAAADDTRISIVRVEEPDDSIVMLAQYQLRSIAALEQKLAQYPRGSSFTLDVKALDSRTAPAIVSELTTFAAAHGMSVRR